jgi:hypothetical protein
LVGNKKGLRRDHGQQGQENMPQHIWLLIARVENEASYEKPRRRAKGIGGLVLIPCS